MKFNLNDKPNMFSLLVYGLQWWVVTLPCVIIMGMVLSKAHYTSIAWQTLYLQKLFIITGLTCVLQVLWGHRLPLIVGPASVLLIGVLSTLSVGHSAIHLAIIFGGVFLVLLSISGLLNKLHQVFTPRIIAIILMLIAFSLVPTIIKLVVDDGSKAMFNIFFSLGLILALVISNKYLQGLAKATTLIWGLLIGSLVYFLLSGQSFTLVKSDEVIAFNFSNLFLNSFDFNLPTIIAFLFCYIALIINEIGSIEAVAHLLKADHIEKRMKRGLLGVGLSNILSGASGVVGSVDFTTSVGLIESTRCASRFTLVPAGLALIACALSPTLIRIFTLIPSPIMGAILLYLMSSQLGTGLNLLVKGKLIHDFNSGLIIALPLMIAIFIANINQDVFTTAIPLLAPIIGNGFVMGCLSVLLLEHLIFRKTK